MCSNLESLGGTFWLFLADTCIQRRLCKYSLVWNISCSWYSCSVQNITKSQSTHKELCCHSRVTLLLLMERDVFCILTSFLWICSKIISFLLEFHFKVFRLRLFLPLTVGEQTRWIDEFGEKVCLRYLCKIEKNFNNLKLVFALLSISEST